MAIARAIITQPDILIMDEPTASLDGDTGRSVVDFVHRDLLNDNRCIIVVTHDDRIYEFASRILNMEDGRLTGAESAARRPEAVLAAEIGAGIAGPRRCIMRYRLALHVCRCGLVAGIAAGDPFFQHREAGPAPGIQSGAESLCERHLRRRHRRERAGQRRERQHLSGSRWHGREILVAEGQTVKKGTPLLQIDDSVQSATTEQLRSQAEAALSLLQELKAQPRPENLSVVQAQVVAAQANLKTAQDTLDKLRDAYEMNRHGTVSMDTLDSADNAVAVAKANLDVAQNSVPTKAGAWVYDVKNQENQYQALQESYSASAALLAKYTLRAPRDGVVLSISATLGSYVSPQGAYDTYTAAATPVITLGTPQDLLSVRCYVDEILVPRVPPPSVIKAEMSIRGTDIKLPMDFVRVQPLVSPKIELSDQRTERVDVRVLPIIFRVQKPKNVNLYPGQLVDVYIGQ